MIDVRAQAADFEPGLQLARLEALGKGAVASLIAMVETKEGVSKIVVEQYAAMAKAELGRIAAEAEARWPLAGIILIHRHGTLAPGDRILFVGVAAADREAATEALSFLSEAVRERAPFWRKEKLPDGAWRWTESLPSEG